MKIKFVTLLLVIPIFSCTITGGEGGPALTGNKIFSVGNFVYVFNPEWGIVSKVDPSLGTVTNITLGKSPADAKGTPDGSVVVVLNRGSENVYIIDSDNDSITIKSTSRNLNGLEVSPSSDFAIAYHIYSESEEFFEGILKLNEYSIINLKTPDDDTVFLTLGGGAPQGVKFSPDGSKILIISRNRCFVLDSSNPQNISSIELWPDPSNIIIPVQIEITPNSRFAFIRTQNTDYVYIIDLDQARVIDVLEGNKPTFFGIYSDGTRALYVNSGNNTIVLLRIDYIAGRVYQTNINADLTIDTAVIQDYDACATLNICNTPGEPLYFYDAILFSSSGSDKKILYLSINGETGVITKTIYGYLPAPVAQAYLSSQVPNKVLLTHRGFTGFRSVPVTLIDLIDESANPIYLDAPPTSVTLYPYSGSQYAFFTLKDSNKLIYYDLVTDNSDFIKINKVPTTAGAMKDMLYILHDQPLGVITFLNLANFEVKEIQGVYVNGLLDR